MKITILYPWGDILARRAGASMRVGLLIDYLKERCEEVRVFSPGPDQIIQQVENVRYVFFSPKGYRTWGDKRDSLVLGDPQPKRPAAAARIAQARLFKRVHKFLWKRLKRLGYPEITFLDQFYRYRHDWLLRLQMERMIAGSDFVLLEYPFWAKIVTPLCKKYRTPSILTLYDALCETYHSPSVLKRILLRAELWALRHSDYRFCVSEKDALFFKQYGIDVNYAVNPIDIEKCSPQTCSAVIRDFLAKHSLLPGRVCLFVGSFHPPNVEAVGIIEKIAGKLPDCTFVLAGNCTSRGRSGNILRLGEVAEEDLRCLYTVADLVLVPLRRGTGSSLKFIEALAYGRPVLASTVGTRGYSVENELHAVISDDFHKYPEIITSILNDETQKKRLSCNARRFAEQYDYRRIYEPYWQIICQSHASPEVNSPLSHAKDDLAY